MMKDTNARLDHLVILADTLAQGERWCEATLGVTPSAGGEHPLMGTHNRLMHIASPAFPRAYLEIITLNPGAVPTRAAGQKRWFDMDDPALRKQVANDGPRLIHWVAAVPDLASTHAAWLQQLQIDRGSILKASRPTANGLLEWQITVRDDGQRLLDGCLPTLIEWGATHPSDALPASGVQLQSLQLAHADAALLEQALAAAHLAQTEIAVTPNPPHTLRATLSTPRGLVTLNA
ncbi:VOC family protein [Diaphorobacter sp. HDW4A]|uniref:VOC family protein n=1 Tax=Diaphorobacter sp. HDW4A TaxID=2714924 RepID=UPI00140C64AC|nr:VOC family protein [Diaphorobacter sp. HDW4A]QIL83235.1 VOC family protein [Diaphorobacter sp. HDW4A]